MAKRRESLHKGPFVLKVLLDRARVPSFDQFPFNLPAVRALSALELHPRVTFLVGENGSGKSTLIEAMAMAAGLNPEGGSRNFNFNSRPTHSALDRYLKLVKPARWPTDSYFLRAETFYNVATEIEAMDAIPSDAPKVGRAYGDRPLHEQSHGESFFALFQNRFRGEGLYFLDEPESALSPKRQLSFLTLLHDFCRGGSQFIIATHAPIIMAYPDAWIYVLGPEGPTLTPYDDTEHYQVARAFLLRKEKMLETLLAEDEEPESEQSE